MDVIRLPDIEKIETVSGAYEYASRVHLSASRSALRFPPTEEQDAQWAPEVYDPFRTLTIHTDEDIARFETKHTKLIEQRLREHAILEGKHKKNNRLLSDYGQLAFGNRADEGVIHTPLPKDAGKVTRFSLALLYGAIVYKVISNRTFNEKSLIEPSEYEKVTARGICAELSTFMHVDERMGTHWLTWFDIIDDVHRLGLGAAINKHQINFPDGSKVRLSGKHVKNMEQKVLQKKKDLLTYGPLSLLFFAALRSSAERNPVAAKKFREDFSKTEDSIYDQ